MGVPFQPKSEFRDPLLAVLVFPLCHYPLASQSGVVFHRVEIGKDEDSDSWESVASPPPHQVIPTSAHPFQSTSMHCIPLNGLVFYCNQCIVWHCIVTHILACFSNTINQGGMRYSRSSCYVFCICLLTYQEVVSGDPLCVAKLCNLRTYG